jgi:hypothetical protein
MNRTSWALLGAVLVAASSLFAGLYLDLVIRQVGPGSSINDLMTAFGVHLDFARSEEWHGYFVDQERSGEWKIHEETINLTDFVHSNRVIGSASDPRNPPPWDITGYVKSDSKFLVYTGADVGAGVYIVKAHVGGIDNKKDFSNTLFKGYIFGWNVNEKNETKFRRCPLVLLREADNKEYSISVNDVSPLLSPAICNDLTFPELLPEGSVVGRLSGRDVPSPPS